MAYYCLVGSACENGKGGRKANWQGMNWLRQEKRLAIYLRDGKTCVYCLATEVQLSVDHVVPVAVTGKPNNHATNLVTACCSCNFSRQDKSLEVWASPEAIARVEVQTKLPLDVKAAKKILASLKEVPAA